MRNCIWPWTAKSFFWTRIWILLPVSNRLSDFEFVCGSICEFQPHIQLWGSNSNVSVYHEFVFICSKFKIWTSELNYSSVSFPAGFIQLRSRLQQGSQYWHSRHCLYSENWLMLSLLSWGKHTSIRIENLSLEFWMQRCACSASGTLNLTLQLGCDYVGVAFWCLLCLIHLSWIFGSCVVCSWGFELIEVDCLVSWHKSRFELESKKKNVWLEDLGCFDLHEIQFEFAMSWPKLKLCWLDWVLTQVFWIAKKNLFWIRDLSCLRQKSQTFE